PEGKVHARVEGGWVTLDGEVEWGFQRHEVERMVRQVRGVIGVTDTIVVKPSASPQSVQAVIKETFKREAEIDARHVRVEVSDHTAKLYGHVHSLQEANAARAGAASTSRTALEVALQATTAAGAHARLVWVRDLDLPLYTADLPVRRPVREFVDAVYACDAMIWSSPTYHGSFSGQ